jgi:hypothetical protein
MELLTNLLQVSFTAPHPVYGTLFSPRQAPILTDTSGNAFNRSDAQAAVPTHASIYGVYILWSYVFDNKRKGNV